MGNHDEPSMTKDFGDDAPRCPLLSSAWSGDKDEEAICSGIETRLDSSDKQSAKTNTSSETDSSGHGETPKGANCAQTYQYASLENLPSDSIRLLRIHPGRRDGPIRSSLFTVRQSQEIPYAALSYVWGKSESNRLLFVDGKRLHGRWSLWQFLNKLRHAQRPLVVWVDAICINQDSVLERGHQVRLMGTIYQNAQLVYSWLGNDDAHTASYLTRLSGRDQELLETLRTEAIRTRDRIPSVWSKLAAAALGFVSADDEILPGVIAVLQQLRHLGVDNSRFVWPGAIQHLNPLNHEDFAGFLQDICQREYWTRTWVVQELLLANSIILCIGDMFISWDDLEWCFKAFDNHARSFRSFASNASISNATSENHYTSTFSLTIGTSEPQRLTRNFIHARRRPSDEARLGDLLRDHIGQKCADPRDRVYALLSLATDCIHVYPDYTKSTLDLFFDLKDTVEDHVALRLSLELSVKHIRERARVLQRETYARNGEICVQPGNAKFMADDGNAKDFDVRKRYIDTYAKNAFGSGQSSYGNELQEYMRAFAKSRGTLGLGQSSTGSGNESYKQQYTREY